MASFAAQGLQEPSAPITIFVAPLHARVLHLDWGSAPNIVQSCWKKR
jgi:hypothetical protein